jgi:hypothetical protein
MDCTVVDKEKAKPTAIKERKEAAGMMEFVCFICRPRSGLNPVPIIPNREPINHRLILKRLERFFVVRDLVQWGTD